MLPMLIIFLCRAIDKNEYVKMDMFFMRWLIEEKKKKPMSFGSTMYKNEQDEMAQLSKLNPSPTLEKKGEAKGKEKVEPSGGEKKGMLVLTKNNGSPPSLKRQTTIDESLKKPIEVELISTIKIIEPEEAVKEERAL